MPTTGQAIKVGDIWTNILSSVTGESVNYEVVTSYWDGTAMDDSKVDGVIYRKRGNEYLKLASYQGTADISWFGAKGDGVTDDTHALQKALDFGGEIKLNSNKTYKLSTVANSPDGSAGRYCLLATKPVALIADSAQKTKLLIEANNHGIIVFSDDVCFRNITIEAIGNVGTIGHHIKIFGGVHRPYISQCIFNNVSDAAINVGVHLDNVLAGADPWSQGAYDVTLQDNIINDAKGDAGIELMGLVGGIVSGNRMIKCEGHGIRSVGNRNLIIRDNFGQDIGYTNHFSAVISAFSGAITPTGVDPIPLYNENITIYNNVGRNCRDGIHIGIGAIDIKVFGNDMEVNNVGLYIAHSGSVIGRWGLKNSEIYYNRFQGGIYGCTIAVLTGTNLPPVNTHLLDNVLIEDNSFSGYTQKGIRTIDQDSSRKLINSKIRNNKLDADTGDGFANASGIEINYTDNCDISGNISNLTNGKDAIIYVPTNTIFSYNKSVKVIISSNKLVSPSPRNWKTGQIVVFKTTDTPPGGIQLNTPYWIYVISNTSIYLCSSLTNAFAGTGVSITSGGVGDHYIEFL